MPFQIIRNDITKVTADAIVNTANPEPIIGGGTDWAIHNAAGPELLEARKKIGDIDVGESVATPAYGLSASYVIHTVSPIWIDGQHQEEEWLRKAYDSALELAAVLGCRSIAFPLMATGTYEFPHDLALAVAIRAFTDFLMDHSMQIYLVLFSAAAVDVAGSIFDDLKSFIDDNYVSEKNEEEYLIDNLPPGYYDRRDEAIRRRRREREAIKYNLSDTFAAPSMAPIPASSGYSSIEDALKQHESSFSEYLLDLLIEMDKKNSEVYKRAEVSKQLFSKILNNKDYQPTKSTVIQLAIGLELDLTQTQKLLEKAGYALTRSSKTDLVVQYFIDKKMYSVTLINEALYDCGLPLLKTGLSA